MRAKKVDGVGWVRLYFVFNGGVTLAFLQSEHLSTLKVKLQMQNVSPPGMSKKNFCSTTMLLVS